MIGPAYIVALCHQCEDFRLTRGLPPPWDPRAGRQSAPCNMRLARTDPEKPISQNGQNAKFRTAFEG